MKNIFAIVELSAVIGDKLGEWKVSFVDCVPMIDDGVTEEEDIQDWAFEKNCTEGYEVVNYKFFDKLSDAEHWVKENGWYN